MFKIGDWVKIYALDHKPYHDRIGIITDISKVKANDYPFNVSFDNNKDSEIFEEHELILATEIEKLLYL